MAVCRMVSPSILNESPARSQMKEYWCQTVSSTVIATASCWSLRLASRRNRRENGRMVSSGATSNPGATSRDGSDGDWIIPAKNPWAGISSCRASQLGGEAWKNQAAFGRTGKRPAAPPKPSEKPKGSFHSPNPHVPGRFNAETRARRLKVRGGEWGKCRREMVV